MRAILRLWKAHALVRLFAINCAVGFALAGAFVGAVLASDFAGLAHLFTAAHAWGFVALLWFFTGLTFASVQMGMAVMLLDYDDQQPGGGKRQRVPARLAPALARAPTPRGHSR